MKFKRFMALALAGVMTMAMAGTAFAADAPKITKTINANEDITIPAGKEFTFTATYQTTSPFNPNVPQAVPTQRELTTTITTVADQKTGYEAAFDFASVCTKPGEYVFLVTETDSSDSGYGWKCNTGTKTSYYVQVLRNAEGEFTYRAIDAAAEVTTTVKEGTLAFENIYTRRGGDGPDGDGTTDSLVIDKTITGDSAAYANPDDTFDFTISFTAPEIQGNESTVYVGTIDDKEAVSIDVSSDTKSGTFSLKAGQSIVFKSIPVGAKYTVTEAKEGLAAKNYSYEDGDKTDIAIVEAGNVDNYKNKYTDIVIAGLALNIAPFIAMFAAVAGAIALYVAAKRRVR